MPMARGWSRRCATTMSCCMLYLGDEMFDEMGHAYVKARPSEHPNLRWFSQGLPEFLKIGRALLRSSRAVRSRRAGKSAQRRLRRRGRPGARTDRHGRLCAGGVARPRIPAASQRVQARSLDQRGRDLAGAQERRDAAGGGRAGDTVAPADLAPGRHADVPRTLRRRSDDVGRGRERRSVRRALRDACDL